MKSTHRRKSGVLFLSQKPYKCEGHLTGFAVLFQIKLARIKYPVKLPPYNEKYTPQKKRCTFFIPKTLQMRRAFDGFCSIISNQACQD